MTVITKELALAIAKKLQATMDTRPKVHDIAVIEYNGKMIARFGIRRGSRKDAGHDHIPTDLHVTPRDARLLGQCPLSREDWIKIMSEKGSL